MSKPERTHNFGSIASGESPPTAGALFDFHLLCPLVLSDRIRLDGRVDGMDQRRGDERVRIGVCATGAAREVTSRRSWVERCISMIR